MQTRDDTIRFTFQGADGRPRGSCGRNSAGDSHRRAGECEHGRENKILDCISKDFASLPSWLGVFITTRPEVEIWKKLEKFNPSVIVPESEKNMADLRIFFAHALDGMLTSEEERAEAASILAEKSGGIFIYAKYAVERLRSEKGEWTLEKIRDFPAGLDDFYEEQFRRIWVKVARESTAFKFASLIVVAREPLEVDALQAMVGCEAVKGSRPWRGARCCSHPRPQDEGEPQECEGLADE